MCTSAFIAAAAANMTVSFNFFAGGGHRLAYSFVLVYLCYSDYERE